MWGTIGIPILVIASAFLAAALESIAAGCAGLLFLGLLFVLPVLWQLPALSIGAVTGLTSVVVLCVSLPFAFVRGWSRLRLFLHGPLVLLALLGAVATPSLPYPVTLSGVFLIVLLWAIVTTLGGGFPGGQGGRRGWAALSVSAVVCLSSLAAGAGGLGLRPLTDQDDRVLGEAALPFPPRGLLLAALVIAAAKALSGQTRPILAGGTAMGALAGLLVAFLVRRLFGRK